jgi:DNA-binding transcriptional ArsR family regulator
MQSLSALDRTLSAVAHPIRRGIVEQLARRERSVSELVEAFDISQPAITKHLNQLEAAGVIERRQVGRQRICRIRPRTLRETAEWLHRMERLWGDRLDALTELLTSTTGQRKER